MPFVIKKIIVILIVITSLAVLAVGAFIGFGFYVNDKNEVFPNIHVDGVDISGFTLDEIIKTLDVANKEQQKRNAAVTVTMPDGSQLHITGEDAGLRSNLLEVINAAFTYGRGYGFVEDTMSYINLYLGEVINFESYTEINYDYIYSATKAFVENYNAEFKALTPVIKEDSITITKGAGYTFANADEIYDIISVGIFESLESGQTLTVEYSPPEFPEFQIVAELETLWQDTRILPISAVYDKETRTITRSVVGVTFDFTEAMNALRAADIGDTVTIDLIDLEPEMSTEYMESFLFVDIIGEQTTNVGGSADRLFNVGLAASKIHGTVLEPGEEFSYNRVVGPRTRAAGFRIAPVIINKEYALDIGGGICQVSSTLYSAIMDTGLLITERRAHGLPISYLPHGRDATVVDGGIDFRFVNNTNHPIRIDFFLVDRKLTARVEGTLPEGWVPTLR